MNYGTDLILAEAFCIFIFFHFPDSALSVLTGLHFTFDGVTVKTENTLIVHICNAERITVLFTCYNIQFLLKYEKHMNCFVVDLSQGNTEKDQEGLRGLREAGLSERGVALEALH